MTKKKVHSKQRLLLLEPFELDEDVDELEYELAGLVSQNWQTVSANAQIKTNVINTGKRLRKVKLLLLHHGELDPVVN